MFVHNGLTFAFKIEVSHDIGDDPVHRYFNDLGAAKRDFAHWRDNPGIISVALYEHTERTAKRSGSQEPLRLERHVNT